MLDRIIKITRNFRNKRWEGMLVTKEVFPEAVSLQLELKKG